MLRSLDVVSPRRRSRALPTSHSVALRFGNAPGSVSSFETEIDGVYIDGVDIIRWNDDGRITDFKVMLRPLKAVNTVHAKMAEMLQRR